LTWYSIWLLIAPPVGLLWLVRVFAVEAALRARCLLHEGSFDPGAPGPHGAPKISIVLAGKDEEDNIEACVRSLLDQDYPNYELIVVDDRSTDGTPEILVRLAKEYEDRLRVLRVTTLPPGWFGKHNAIRTGMAAASGEWLLFTDADCRQTSRRTLSLAMSEALHHKSDFLSVLPNLERCTFWERVLQPICAAILMVWFRPGRVNNPASPAAYANGAFMLMSRECYNAIGGHEAVRDKINEDIHMAAMAKQRGQRLRVVENQGLYLARMYDTPMAAYRGWSRIFYGCLEKPSRIVVALLLVSMGGVFPWVSFLVALCGALATQDPRWWKATAAWGIVIGLMQLVIARLYFAVGYGLWWSFSYVLGAAISSAILVNALLKALGVTSTTWRRTTYGSTVLARDSSTAL
jgi:chlorobactene glucosyltransferase